MKLFKLFNVALLCMALAIVSCSGKDGADGEDGESIKGDPGNDGDDGLACWDLNNNGSGDITEGDDNEDINLDGVVDALDCQGADGADGEDGENRPNVDFFFQNGFKDYEGTQDVQISQFSSENDGFIGITENLDLPITNLYSVIRFDGLSDMVNGEFDTDIVSCGDAYSVNQAILYLYADELAITEPINQLYVHLGFYGPQDPLFDEATATWAAANSVEGWFGAGALGEFVGPFTGTDDYTVNLGIFANSSQKMGWIAIPLPRDVVYKWLCDETESANKGIRLRLTTDSATGSTGINFYSSEADQVDLRPLLVIQTEEVDAATENAGKGSFGQSSKSWKNMTQEEKMAPLHKFLSSK
ncbi:MULTISPECIES: hypothetical protein [Flavobacteriaceae]|uniref:hypothetical protein n=1 Tax=Flavobacteriaceae TaxID=49546 RepID=UPI0014913F86|nr:MULTISPECIES: hypothetical protein [Allomuricauda]MDC6366337.1 hypothetical protein [Muricauda sp. AC10]